jgi:hypothetical protein
MRHACLPAFCLCLLACTGCIQGAISNPCGDGARLVDGACYPLHCPGRRCPTGWVCIGERCVEEACLGVACLPSEACASGTCFPRDCQTRTCPGLGEVCVEEQCTPASCLGVSCESGQVCANGRCYPTDCLTHHCPGFGEVCVAEVCTERTCVGVDCPAGLACAGGRCYPADCGDAGCFSPLEVCIEGECVRRTCVDVGCPDGQRCANGYCYPRDCPQRECSDFGEVCFEEACIHADCLGVVCPAGQRCARGECFPEDCAGWPCGQGEVCFAGRCTAAVCVGRDCPSGMRCADGACHETDCVALGLGCGLSEVCVVGQCVPARCAHVSCPAGEVCGLDGACHPWHCQARACGPFELCLDGTCVERGCVGLSCPPGSLCAAGRCWPTACEADECPAGQICSAGACEPLECADCRCCPRSVCGLLNQCERVDCCGVEMVCLFQASLGIPVWSEGGVACTDGDMCTGPDLCGPGGCLGAPMRCEEPPPNRCEGQTRIYFNPQGVCIQGACQYPELRETCEQTCAPAGCGGEPCGALVCDPGERCVAGACACGGTGPDCPADRTCCLTECVDTRADARHCGVCGFACGAHARCVAGRCECDTSFGNCNGDWGDGCEEDLRSSPTHCGGCGQPCPAGSHADAACAAGRCAYACQAGWSDCDADPATCEVRTSDDDLNCGGCALACGARAHCVSSRCECENGFGNCNSNFPLDGCETDLLSSAQHCGACNAPCQPGANATARCAGGECLRGCVAPWLDCGGDMTNCLINPLADSNNCGFCGNACGPNARCQNGVCQCNAGYENCNRDWQDGCEAHLATDMAHCGGCDRPCQLPHASETCQAGECRVTACEPDRGNCNGLHADGCESDLQNDPAHCGSCPNDCGLDAVCQAGACACVPPLYSCDGLWSTGCEADITSDPLHCGGCGNDCSRPQAVMACQGGCVLVGCQAGYFNVDQSPVNGCECADGADVGDTCAGSPVNVGVVSASQASLQRSGVLVKRTGHRVDEDCYLVQYSRPAPGSGTFRTRFNPDPGSLEFRVWRNDCNTSVCGGDTTFTSTCASTGGACQSGNGNTFIVCVRALAAADGLCLPYTILFEYLP